MKKELFYYWEYFCQLNAILCGTVALTLLFYPNSILEITFNHLANFFTFPLVLNHKMKTKLRYRFLIAISLIFILEPIWNTLAPQPIHPAPVPLFIASGIFSLLALGNYLYQKKQKSLGKN
ncbi:hypothetical protein AB1I63_09360 [Streptococcus pneumoniae]